jgi:uncharacterized alkaline shock family protein YloU
MGVFLCYTLCINMAQESITLVTNESGIIVLKKDVFNMIALISAKEEKGIVIEHSALHKAVTCKIVENNLSVSINVKIQYGQNVQKMCSNLQSKVKKAIVDMAGLETLSIEVNVIGFNFNAQ